jgi:putative acetyltransferase
MPKDIKIRKIKKKDLQAVYLLVQKTIEISYSDVYPFEAIELFKEYHSKENITKDANTGYSIIVEFKGSIVGTGTLLETNIRRVFVSPFYQNQGIGKLISKEIGRQALADKVSILDLSSSLVARRFWESMGFRLQAEDFIPASNGQRLIFYKMDKILNTDQ